MRYGIFCDVHGNLEALQAVVADLLQESIDVYLCCGDIIGYGANPRECIKAIRGLCGVSIGGNHDRAAVALFSTTHFNPAAAEAILWTGKILSQAERAYLSSLDLVFCNQDLTLAHGTLHQSEHFYYMVDRYAAAKTFAVLAGSVCFVGHSHIAGVFIQDQRGTITYEASVCLRLKRNYRYIVNCGSVGQPRDGNPDAAYCIYDTATAHVSVKRVAYDRSTARQKIIASGLPDALGDRLLFGR